MKIKELFEGGWDHPITQGTTISPNVVSTAMSVMKKYVNEFNAFTKLKDLPPIQLGYPTGSSAYYKVDDEDKIYGDVDLQIIIPNLPELEGKPESTIKSFWDKLSDEFIQTKKPSYIHEESKPGHPIIKVGQDAWVQIDLMPHTEQYSKWGRFRTTPERGMKGMLYGNMYSVLGEMLMMSIQHRGAQYKFRSKQRQPYATTRHSKAKGNYELITVTTDIENFILDIFKHEYEQLTNQSAKNAKIHPLLKNNPGTDINDIKIQQLVNGVKGLALSLEMNDLFGKNHLSKFSSASDFLNQFFNRYEEKALKDVNSAKRDKAASPDAIERADADRNKILTGLEIVRKYFG